ncbi:MAG TPA: zinc-ribbon domain-containing protein [Pseudolabrys sp.]|nr:zinc-ribbon domain-containing protein [Pseudolabrys sp.]
MLIVCPSCATSYTLPPASVGAKGRNVRCARCKTMWFVAPQAAKVDETVTAFVDDVIAEAQGQPAAPPPPPPSPMPPVREDIIDGPVSAPPVQSEQGPVSDETAAFRDALSEREAEATAAAPTAAATDTPANAEHPVAEAPSLVPAPEPDNPDATVPPPPVEDVEDFAARRARRQARRKVTQKKSKLPYLILTLIGVNVALVTWRADVVRVVPQTASLFSAIGLPVNLRGLEFKDVKITSEDDGMNVLVVEGNIISTTRHAVEVPRLRFSVRNAAGQEIYSWTAQAGRSVLGPHESLPFRSRLASPPEDAHDVVVRFLSPRDMSGGK